MASPLIIQNRQYSSVRPGFPMGCDWHSRCRGENGIEQKTYKADHLKAETKVLSESKQTKRRELNKYNKISATSGVPLVEVDERNA